MCASVFSFVLGCHCHWRYCGASSEGAKPQEKVSSGEEGRGRRELFSKRRNSSTRKEEGEKKEEMVEW